jgi:hypothetical protein
MPDELSGSSEPDYQQASPESRVPDVSQALPTNGNGHSPGDSLHPEEASPKTASDADATVASSANHNPNASDGAKPESDDRQFSTASGNGNGALEWPEHIPEPAAQAEDAKRLNSSEIPDEEKCAAADKRSNSPGDTAKRKRPSAMVELVRFTNNNRVGLFGFGFPDSDSMWQACSQEDSDYFPLPYFAEVSLALPSERRGNPEPTRDLFRSIVNLLRKHVRLSFTDECLVANWSMATWFSDLLPFIPSLVITGSPSGADLLLKTLASICRRPLLLGELSPAVLRLLGTLRPKVTPTLLVREPRLSKRVAMWLESSNYRGYLAAWGRDLQDQPHFPNGVYVGEDRKNPLTNSIRVHVGDALSRSLEPPPTTDDTQNFQNRLLGYRFQWRDEVAESASPASGFQAEVGTVFEMLGTVIVDDPGLQAKMIKLFKKRDEPPTGLEMEELVRRDDRIELVQYTSTEDGTINQLSRRIKLRSELGPQHEPLLESLILPADVQEFRTTRELFNDITALLRKHAILPSTDCSLLAHWAIATWFTDCLPFPAS